MTDDDKSLVERLREGVDNDGYDYLVEMADADMHEAADRIESLSAENERLRGALKDALSHCYNCSGDPHYIEEDEVTGDHLWTDCPVCRSARAALGETK